MAGRKLHSRGITLLELLVAMTLMVVVASSLYTALYTSFRAYRGATSAVNPTSQAMNAIELLKQDIYGVLPPTGILAGAFVGMDMRGDQGVDADSLEFYTTQIHADRDKIVGGIARIEFGLERDLDMDRFSSAQDSYKLVRKVTTNLLSPRVVEPDEQVLARNVVSLNLRYFNGETWVDSWDSIEDANSLPRAMEVDIQVLDVDVTNNTRNTTTRVADMPKRRLVQSFTIPCGLTALTEEELAAATGGGAGQGDGAAPAGGGVAPAGGGAAPAGGGAAPAGGRAAPAGGGGRAGR